MTGALFAAWLNPLMTSRKARSQRREELKLEAYARGLQAIDQYMHSLRDANRKEARLPCAEAASRIQLIGHNATSRFYDELLEFIDNARKAQAPDSEQLEKLVDEYLERRETFLLSARIDLGYHKPLPPWLDAMGDALNSLFEHKRSPAVDKDDADS